MAVRDIQNLYRGLQQARGLLGDYLPVIPVLGQADAVVRAGEAAGAGNYAKAAEAVADVVPVGRVVNKAIKLATRGKGASELGPMTNILAGAGSKTADEKARNLAIKMEKQGKTQPEVYQKTGFYRDMSGGLSYEIPDVDSRLIFDSGLTRDGPTPLNRVLEHPELFKAYPQLQDFGVILKDTPGATFQPRTNLISIGPDFSANPADLRSALLHEAQHGVQALDWKPGGWSSSRPTDAAREKIREAIDRTEVGSDAYKRAVDMRNALYSAKSAKEIREKGMKDNIKPSSVRRMSNWYALNSDARSRIGPQPKKPGPERDAWARRALEEMALLAERDAQGYETLPKQEIESLLKEASSNARQYAPAGNRAARNEAALKDFRSSWDFYQTNAGEAEARAVQARRDMPVDQARKTIPLSSYDVPLGKVWGIQGGLLDSGIDSSLLNRYQAPQDEALALAQKRAALPVSEGGLGLPADNTPMDRAKAMGFDVDNPLYHGTTADLTYFDTKYSGSDGVGYATPAVFSSSDSNLASDYAANKYNRDISDAMRSLTAFKNENPGVYDDNYEALYGAVKKGFADAKAKGYEVGEGANVIPLLSRGNLIGMDANGRRFMDVIPGGLEDAKRQGFGGARFTGVVDNASDSTNYPSDVTAVFDPSQLRSRFAAFDPFRRNESDLLAIQGGLLDTKQDSSLLNRYETDADRRMEIARRNAALPIEQGGLGLPENNTAMDRAKAMGFVDIGAHYTPSDFDAFEIGTRPDNHAVWSTRDKSQNMAAHNIGATENMREGVNAMPLMASVSSRLPLTAKREIGLSSDFPRTVTQEDAARAKQAGFDYANIGTETAVFDPTNVRSRFAAFDPMRRNEADLLALNGGQLNSGLLNINPLLGLFSDE